MSRQKICKTLALALALAMGGAVWPVSVWAQEPAVAASVGGEEKRFLPLRATKQRGDMGLKGDSSAALPSDRAVMDKGFMPIDRSGRSMPSDAAPKVAPVAAPVAPAATPVATPAPAAPATTASERESEEIEGNTEGYNPVLSLFDSGGSMPAATSFYEAMRSNRHVDAALTRHPVWPVPLRFKQYLSSGYGMRSDPFTKRPAFHGGIDIVAQEGTPIVATADGTVSAVGEDKNYGKYVAITHADGTTSRYGHLSEHIVAQGATVHAGEAIGALGSTGRSTGPHLDYRVSKNNMKYDPLNVLTIPKEVAINNSNKVAVPSPYTPYTTYGRPVASSALPKRPMVIEIR